jgi:magnesium transporter
VTLPATATVREAAALLVRHRLLAVPIVGALDRMLGVVDAAALDLDIATELTGERVEEIFQLIGVRLAGAAPSGFAARFPSLLWTVFGGLIAAAIAGAHEHLLNAFTALALFMPVTLALSESIGIQSVVLAIERAAKRSHRREARIALALAAACAAIVCGVATVWQRDVRLAAVVALALPIAMVTTAIVGLLLPRVLLALRRNPSVAAGPMVLAIADFVSLIVYFRIAALVLR